ncbi:glycosyltransferase family protein, partial [Cellulomonas bogoriensis]|uniref:hypothetical protein n=1 Tax=Cellulomonas bogoriensis TaxID=301388 RepID=UPI000556D437
MGLRGLGKRLPPIARRDAELRRYRDRLTQLERELARAQKRIRRLERSGPTAEEMAARVRTSGLFDAPWYLAHTGDTPDDPVLHYLTVGDAAGLSPHPAFDPATYRRHLRPRRCSTPTLWHYLTSGARTGTSPHPAFDAEAYLATAPQAADHPGGALGHYLEHGAPGVLTDGTLLPAPADFLASARRAGAVHHLDAPTVPVEVDWEQALAAADERTDVLSVVVVVSQDPARAATGVRRVTQTAEVPTQVVVVDCCTTRADRLRLRVELDGIEQVHIHTPDGTVPAPAARNIGAALTTGRTVVFVPDTAWVFPGWDSALLQTAASHVAVQPLVLDRGGSIWSAGVALDPVTGPHHPLRGYAGDAPEARGERVVDAVDTCLCLGAEGFLRARGFDTAADGDLVGPDLSVRLRAAGRS